MEISVPTSKISIINPQLRPMDEIWENITFPSHHHRAGESSSFNGGISLHDFLHKDPNPYSRLPMYTGHCHRHNNKPAPSSATGDPGFLFGRRSSLPETFLSLNSGHLDHLFDTPESQSQIQSQHKNPSCVYPSPFSKKRTSAGNVGGDDAVDRRHKRKMKNRESAARSRARRQARTTELEQEKEELKAENEKLKRQLEKEGISTEAEPGASAHRQLNSRKGHSLCRTLTL